MANYLRYANQGATRNQPLNEQLVKALSYLGDMGVTGEVFSGGQPGKGSGQPRVGSVRHDHGNAGDIRFYQGDRALDWSNPNDRPVFEDIVRRGKQAGITGFGAGPGYMGQGTMHVGFGSPGVWGAGGKGANAPQWLRDAYNGASGPNTMAGGAGSDAPSPYAAMPDGPKGQEAYKPPVFGSIGPTPAPAPEMAGGIPAGVGVLLGEKKPSIWDRLAAFGAAIDQGIPPAPSTGGGGGGGRPGQLLNALSSPSVGDLLIKKRLGLA